MIIFPRKEDIIVPWHNNVPNILPYYWFGFIKLIMFEMYFHTIELFIYFCAHEWSLGVVVSGENLFDGFDLYLN